MKLANTLMLPAGKKSILATRNLVPGRSVYGERAHQRADGEWREWNPADSKLAAAIAKGLPVAIDEGDAVLYLGASTGTTVSHVSDIIGKKGIVFALDSAPRVLRDLIFLAEERPNIAPILADAAQPDTFKTRLCEVDFLYQDIAQRQQGSIFIKNAQAFLRKGGLCALALKARSVDVTKPPASVYKAVRKELTDAGLEILHEVTLEPHQKDHCVFLCKRR